jgi:hypothetical protein
MMHDESDPFVYRILPLDPMPDEEPTTPSPEIQQEALNDICISW